MQVKFLLIEKTRNKQIYNNLSVSAKKHDTQIHKAASEVSVEFGETNKNDIKKNIVLLEYIVKTLEKKVHDLKEYTNTLKTVPPSKRSVKQSIKNY